MTAAEQKAGAVDPVTAVQGNGLGQNPETVTGQRRKFVFGIFLHHLPHHSSAVFCLRYPLSAVI